MPQHSAVSADGNLGLTPAVGNSNGNASAIRSAAPSSKKGSASQSRPTLKRSQLGSSNDLEASPAAKLMRLSEVLRARLSRLRGRNVVLPTSGIYIRHSLQPSAFLNPDGLSWNKSQGCLAIGEHSENTSADWSRSGITCFGIAYPLVPLVRLTKETGCGSWRTPNAQDGERGVTKRIHERARIGLNTQVQWPTPRANERGQHNSRDNHMALSLAVQMFPTPTTGKGGSNSKRKERGSGGPNLQEFVQMFPTPRAIYGAHPGMTDPKHLTGAPTARDYRDNGKSPAELARNSPTLATIAGGTLNPTWVEWLMGFPIEWTVCELWATLSSRKSRSKSGKQSTK